MTRYDDVTGPLRAAYDRGAEYRDGLPKSGWKLAEREAFLGRLRSEGCRRLLEVGAGTGQDSRYFQDAGLNVVAVDLSPEMVDRCRRKGVEAYVMDFLGLDFPAGSFDAVYAVNCLLHVPNADLPAVLAAIAEVIRPGGLFFLGVHADPQGSREGVLADDSHDPPRFFSFRTDEELKSFVNTSFDIVDFHTVQAGESPFQALTLRRPTQPPQAAEPRG